MSNYARANVGKAWFGNRYTGSVIKPNVGVIHTTETSGLPGYGGGATAPHYTGVPNFAKKRIDWYAHFPDERSARALQNDAGGVETNTLNALQVELVGTCDPGTRDRWSREKRAPFIFWPEAPDWALQGLADLIVDMNKRHGIKVQGPKVWKAYPASYGQSNPNRLSFAQWRNFYGWLGHQHVPENSHGDPGALPWDKVVALATLELQGGKAPAPETPLADAPAKVAPVRVPSSPNIDAALAAKTREDTIAALERVMSARSVPGAKIAAQAWLTSLANIANEEKKIAAARADLKQYVIEK